MSQQPLVKPLGLITRPGPYNQYPVGAMRQATDLVMRSPGIIEPAPSVTGTTALGAANHVILGVEAIDGGKVVTVTNDGATTDTVRIDSTAMSPVNSVPSASRFSQTGCTKFMRARDRLFITTTNARPVVIDTVNPGSLPQPIRSAGLPQCALTIGTGTNTNAQALPNNACAGYAALIKRVFSDGYQVIGRPSNVYTVLNATGSAYDPVLAVRCSSTMGFLAGDIVELYRTNVITSATAGTDPGTDLKLIKSYVLTSADVAGASVNLRDTTAPGPLNVTAGRALYTNPYQKGLLGAHRVPEICKSIAYFKDACFLANITQRPQIEFQIPGGHGYTQTTGFNTTAFRANGIGTRRGAGVVTIATNTITGVSAADLSGVVAGQNIYGVAPATFPAGTTITNVNTGAGIITTSANATASGTAFESEDVLELSYSGGTLRFPLGASPQQFMASLIAAFTTPTNYEVTTSENVLGAQDATLGIKCVTWVIEPLVPDTSWTLTARATNGANYAPPFPEINLTAQSYPYKTIKNLLKWSNDGQPEHFPATQETLVGGGEIVALTPTADCMLIWCTDGVRRLSGAGGQWRIDPVSESVILSSPRAATALNEDVYGLTNKGLVRVVGGSVFTPLSDAMVGDALPGTEYAETASIIVESNDADEEILIRIDATQYYLYATKYNVFTTITRANITALSYARYPSAGSPCIIIARSPLAGAAPFYQRWNDTAVYVGAQAIFQPMFGKNPFAAYQWIDGVLVFDLSSAGKSVQPSWNGVAATASALKGGSRYVNESRALFGVPRTSPALANAISPGFIIQSQSTPTKFYGLALRYEEVAEQQLHR